MQAARSGSKGPSAQGRAWRALMETHAGLVQLLDEEMQRRVGLALQRYDLLLHVAEGDGGRRMTELAKAVLLTKSGFTSLVDRMERDGLIERRPDPEDRRATRIALTAEGEERFREASALHREVVHRIFASVVTDEEAMAILHALSRVREGLQAGEGDGGGN